MAASPHRHGTQAATRYGAREVAPTHEHFQSAGVGPAPSATADSQRRRTARHWAGITLVALAILTLRPSHGECAGANLAWNACLSEGGTSNRDFACNSNTGTNVLYGSFVLSADQPLCTGIEATVEISASADSLPAWWQLFNVGACRRTSLAASFDFSSDPATACTDMWQGTGIGGIGSYHTYWTTPQVPSGVANQARIRFGAAVPIDSPLQLTAGVEYYAFKLMVNNAKTTGSGSCSGCSTPVCILLSELNVVQSDNQHEALTVAQTSNRVTWQAATSCPGAMAAQNITWGQIRSVMQ